MVRISASLEEGYSKPLVLTLVHYVNHPACPPLAFDFMLRVHVNNGFAMSQKHCIDYLEIQQFKA